eukprot:5139485-Prymnesium_polylepis.1
MLKAPPSGAAQSFAVHAVVDSLCSIDRGGELQKESIRLLRSKDRRFMAATGGHSPHAHFLARVEQWYRLFVGFNVVLLPILAAAFAFALVEVCTVNLNPDAGLLAVLAAITVLACCLALGGARRLRAD